MVHHGGISRSRSRRLVGLCGLLVVLSYALLALFHRQTRAGAPCEQQRAQLLEHNKKNDTLLNSNYFDKQNNERRQIDGTKARQEGRENTPVSDYYCIDLVGSYSQHMQKREMEMEAAFARNCGDTT